MKSNFFSGTLLAFILVAMFFSCNKDGNMHPVDPQDLDEGLVIHFPFDGNSIEVISSKEYDSHGAQYIADRFGNANSAIFVDSNHIEADIDLKRATGTLSFWVKVNDLKNNYPIFSKGGVTVGDTEYRLALKGDSVQLLSEFRWGIGNWQETNSLEDLIVPNVISANKWQHIALRWSDEEELIEVFVDGNQKLSSPYTENWKLVEEYEDDPFASCIGGWLFYGGNHTGTVLRPFIGALDDIRTYNRKLSNNEIRALCALEID
jgi:hypothetical protein